jgi:hypothetical protein
MYIEPAESFDPLACSRLLRSTGLTPTQIRRAMALNRRGWITPSTSAISAWMRTEGHVHPPTRPTDEVRAWLADALNIPRATLFAACAGTTPDSSPLHAVTGSGLPVELCYLPDADDGTGRGWSVVIGDRATFGDLDTMLARVAVEVRP